MNLCVNLCDSGLLGRLFADLRHDDAWLTWRLEIDGVELGGRLQRSVRGALANGKFKVNALRKTNYVISE